MTTERLDRTVAWCQNGSNWVPLRGKASSGNPWKLVFQQKHRGRDSGQVGRKTLAQKNAFWASFLVGIKDRFCCTHPALVRGPAMSQAVSTQPSVILPWPQPVRRANHTHFTEGELSWWTAMLL